MSLIVKVCGMKYPENIRKVLQTGVDWMGFIFYQKSPRYLPTIPENIPFQNIKKTGVFVNADKQFVEETMQQNQLDVLQFHGDEPPDYCNYFLKMATVVKAIPVKEPNDLAKVADYEHAVHYFLFDTKSSEARGGTGHQFNWSVLENYQLKIPFLLSGGISPHDVEQLNHFSHPRWAGVDVNSGFEKEPGRKNANEIETFIKAIKQKT